MSDQQSYPQANMYSQNGASTAPPSYAPASNAVYSMSSQVQAPHAVVHTITFADEPVYMNCPRCRQDIMTVTKGQTGSCTLVSCCLFWTIPCCCSCLIPFCFDRFKDIKHYCPGCDNFLGHFKRL